MDTVLCDELIQEIFLRLAPPSSSAVPLVSKRWLRLYRSSKSHLSLRLQPPYNSTPPLLSSFLSHFPFLSSLSLSSSGTFADAILLSVVSSCPNLRHLRLLSGPVSTFALLALPTSCPHLTSLSISLARPPSLRWLVFFCSLKDLSINFIPNSPEFGSDHFNSASEQNPSLDAELQLETLTISCIRHNDHYLDWLWRSCKNLRKLQLRGCEGIGDDPSNSSFINCIKNLQEIELRTCRTIIDEVLLKLAENCKLLKTLLVYDGGCREALLRFINRSQCNLQKLDLRLPLDLDNRHLMAVAERYRGLSALKLQSCCLVTGEGLKAICSAMSEELEELTLINCDVVDREHGLLTTLGQNLKRLKKLDLSYNEMLTDKEFASMIVSCGELRELKLRGCNGLSDSAFVSIPKSCMYLESVDIMQCCGIRDKGVELLVTGCRRLRVLKVEENKLSDAIMVCGSKLIS